MVFTFPTQKKFLTALIKHAAPDYKVLMFLQQSGQRYIRGVVGVNWQQAQCPNCLIWPSEERLIPEDAEPPEWWWGSRFSE